MQAKKQIISVDEVASSYPDHLSAQQAWRLLKGSLEHAPTVAVGSTYTIEPIIPHLAAEFARRGQLLRPVELPYNSIHQELIAGTGGLNEATDALLMPRLHALVADPQSPHCDCLEVVEITDILN